MVGISVLAASQHLAGLWDISPFVASAIRFVAIAPRFIGKRTAHRSRSRIAHKFASRRRNRMATGSHAQKAPGNATAPEGFPPTYCSEDQVQLSTQSHPVPGIDGRRPERLRQCLPARAGTATAAAPGCRDQNRKVMSGITTKALRKPASCRKSPTVNLSASSRRNTLRVRS